MSGVLKTTVGENEAGSLAGTQLVSDKTTHIKQTRCLSGHFRRPVLRVCGSFQIKVAIIVPRDEPFATRLSTGERESLIRFDHPVGKARHAER